MNNKNIKILFFGTSDFALPILESLIKNKYKITAVITQPDKPVGRKHILTPSPVKEMALENKIQILQPNSRAELSDVRCQLSNVKLNLIITASYGKIIPKNILSIPKFGAINVHPSILPKYRGPSPIQTAILNGDKETGVTIMLMDEKMDSGDILIQNKISLAGDEKFNFLHDKLSQIGADLLIKIIPKWINKKIKPISQDEKSVTYSRIITKEDGKIDWNKSAKSIDAQIRAFSKWPVCWTILAGKRVKIIEAKAFNKNASANLKIGDIFVTKNKDMAVKCGSGFLQIIRLQEEGRNEITGAEYVRGHFKNF
ncbi:methionyl-tRNA formyltransferase [Patescibacteria group bacterium]